MRLTKLADLIKKADVGTKVKNAVTGQVNSYMDELKKIDTYRRGSMVGILNKLNPAKNDRINRAILDLDDLAQNGDKVISRRFFLQKIGKRGLDRQKPILNTIEHTPFEQVKDAIDRTQQIMKPLDNITGTLDDISDVTKADIPTRKPAPKPKADLSRSFTYFVDF